MLRPVTTLVIKLAPVLIAALLMPALAADGEERSFTGAAPTAAGCASDAELPGRLAADPKLARADREERAALLDFYAQRQCAPLWVAGGGLTSRGAAVVAEIAGADAWGLDASAFRLPAAVAQLTAPQAAEAEALISIAVLKYARYARGGRAEPTSLSVNLDRTLLLLSPASVISEIADAPDPAAYLRQLHPHHPQFEALRLKYLAARRAAAQTPIAPNRVADGPDKAGGDGAKEASAAKLLLNMEEWRWMPENLGTFYIAINVPEFMLRVVKNGKVIHSERVIVGKPDKQTPIFSAYLDKVIFHPTWGVPESIKTQDILPSLLRGSSRILERYNLKVQRAGHDVDPATIDWATTDMRSVHIYQPPGGSNVLGVVKFRFPNKHDVYLHDTPDKFLFKASARAFSHGCMRLSEPAHLAELVLGEDQGWSGAEVAAALAAGPQSREVGIAGKIPVHVTYFTAVVDETGRLDTFSDIYGHEMRIAMGIAGKAHLIPKPPPGVTRADVLGRLAESGGHGQADWVRRAFGNN